jgi:pyrroloquinoline-quinone synthase
MPNEFLLEIDRKIAAKNLLQHPFYQEWSKGMLSQETLADYAAQYYHHVAAFPTYLSVVHSKTEDQPTRRMILANLIDEEAGNPNHPELWLMFAGSLGLTAESVKTAKLYTETQMLIDSFREECGKGTVEGLTALYCYESQIPAVSESKIAGLTDFYGLTDPKGLAYFKVHIEADKVHSAVERDCLESYITDSTFPSASLTADKTLDALYGMLDGICVRHGIKC